MVVAKPVVAVPTGSKPEQQLAMEQRLPVPQLEPVPVAVFANAIPLMAT